MYQAVYFRVSCLSETTATTFKASDFIQIIKVFCWQCSIHDEETVRCFCVRKRAC